MNRLTGQQPGGTLVFGGAVNEAATVTVQGKPTTVTADNRFKGPAQAGTGTSTVEVKATDASGNVRTNTYQVTQAGAATSYSYDANGNLIGDGTRTFEWDADNRLVRVLQGATELVRFVYDGFGRRSQKIAGGTTRTYLYDREDIVEERLNTGVTTRYVHGPGIDQPLASVIGANALYYVTDHLGSIVRVTDNTGEPTLTRDYDPWGNPLSGANVSGYAFTGREWDAEIGLYYYRARYYDPGLARFISADSMGVLGGMNLYQYVGNRSAGRVDPFGLAPVDPNDHCWDRCQACLGPKLAAYAAWLVACGGCLALGPPWRELCIVACVAAAFIWVKREIDKCFSEYEDCQILHGIIPDPRKLPPVPSPSPTTGSC